MNDLFPVWSQVEGLLFNGFSVIPVRDKDEGNFFRKTPYSGWKIYQERIVSKEDLWHQLESKKTHAIAIICGKVSGYLEVIDIDVKYQPGCDAQLLSSISTIYPALFDRLRIHQTPSGGFHILYRIADCPGEMPKNLKLAKRPPSADELSADPKSKPKCFFETRGEGGYILAPPSMNYSVFQDVPVPLISWLERESLIALCRAHDQMPEMVKVPKQSTADSNYYDQNPFEHFNQSSQAEYVLSENGWAFVAQRGNFIWFTRPGKQSGVSAAFIIDKRIFYIFTSSTELDSDRGYQPATLLTIFKFNGDFKKSYQYLVQQGFGVINRKKESEIIARRVIDNKPLPANLSVDALEQFNVERSVVAEKYPHGTFWNLDDDGKIRISRELFYFVATGLGFRWYRGDIVHIVGGFIHKIDERAFFDGMKSYIQEPTVEFVPIADALESFYQKSGAFSISRLPLLQESHILKDGPRICYKFYSDQVAQVTADGITCHPYSEFNKLIWSHKVHPRPLVYRSGGRYREFLHLAIGLTNHLSAVIGYLAHEYKDENTGYIIVLTEQCPDPRDGGGSGKNLFGSMFTHTTSYISKAGGQTKFDEKFFQTWNGERIFAISDVPKDFNFLFLKEPSTGTGVMKKLYKDETIMSVEEMPKFMVQTNYSYDNVDGGLKRRIVPVEFTNFFTLAGGVKKHFGAFFPTDWDADDWAGYDFIILNGIRQWLSQDQVLAAPALSDGGWEKQIRQSYHDNTIDFIEEHMSAWIRDGFISNDDFNAQYKAFAAGNGIRYQSSAIQLNKALRAYCDGKGIIFERDARKWLGPILLRGRSFAEMAPF